MNRLSYIIRRLLLAIPTFIGITLVCFALTRILPGGPVEMRKPLENTSKDWVHVSDVVEIIMRLLESDAQGVVNVGTGVATSFDVLAGLIGCEREYLPIPDPASYQFYTRADTSRLLSIIGPYNFKTVEEGLAL